MEDNIIELFANSQIRINDYFMTSSTVKNFEFLSKFTDYPNCSKSCINSQNFNNFETFSFDIGIEKTDIRLSNIGEFLYSLIDNIQEQLDVVLSKDNTYQLSFKEGWIDIGIGNSIAGFNYIRLVIYSPMYGFPILLTIIDNEKLYSIQAKTTIAYLLT